MPDQRSDSPVSSVSSVSSVSPASLASLASLPDDGTTVASGRRPWVAVHPANSRGPAHRAASVPHPH
ncbi:hypothetical protein [Streptomyces sp. VRA16 Mangrove soil]|uniref:hypothetical protein n=1 Tax=Streptomyces sp. VRA16 Mangrove soil TaxID=2817434 RepID=UPI001A9D9125|nr:hypothetical protein [Streptomyces sp. VRA16 Mangrove soil]MBO1329733.1 hypothetical protein [Streptomyces sp. VRA16 Mangrove soil]